MGYCRLYSLSKATIWVKFAGFVGSLNLLPSKSREWGNKMISVNLNIFFFSIARHLKTHKFCMTCQEVVPSLPHPHSTVPIVDNNYKLSAFIPVCLPINVMFAVKYEHWFDTIYAQMIHSFARYNSIDWDLFEIFFDLTVEMREIRFSSDLEKNLLKNDIISKLSQIYTFHYES